MISRIVIKSVATNATLSELNDFYDFSFSSKKIADFNYHRQEAQNVTFSVYYGDNEQIDTLAFNLLNHAKVELITGDKFSGYYFIPFDESGQSLGKFYLNLDGGISYNSFSKTITIELTDSVGVLFYLAQNLDCIVQPETGSINSALIGTQDYVFYSEDSENYDPEFEKFKNKGFFEYSFNVRRTLRQSILSLVEPLSINFYDVYEDDFGYNIENQNVYENAFNVLTKTYNSAIEDGIIYIGKFGLISFVLIGADNYLYHFCLSSRNGVPINDDNKKVKIFGFVDKFKINNGVNLILSQRTQIDYLSDVYGTSGVELSKIFSFYGFQRAITDFMQVFIDNRIITDNDFDNLILNNSQQVRSYEGVYSFHNEINIGNITYRFETLECIESFQSETTPYQKIFANGTLNIDLLSFNNYEQTFKFSDFLKAVCQINNIAFYSKFGQIYLDNKTKNDFDFDNFIEVEELNLDFDVQKSTFSINVSIFNNDENSLLYNTLKDYYSNILSRFGKIYSLSGEINLTDYNEIFTKSINLREKRMKIIEVDPYFDTLKNGKLFCRFKALGEV